jgi:transposase-like protein
MVRPGREKLSGSIEVDETYVGGEEEGVWGRQTDSKAIVAIAVESLTPKGYGRVRIGRIHDVTGDSLISFILDAVEPGSIVNTDGWNGYKGLAKNGYIHNRTLLSENGDPAHVAMPGAHRIASLLKRWLLGTHQGGVLPIQLEGYLDEFTFRFNRRKSRSRGLLFYRLLQNAVVTGPSPYRSIVKHRK